MHSIYRWHSQHRVALNGGIPLKNFKKLACVYENVMKIHGLLSVLVLAAEDETAIIGQVTYNEGKDEVLGFCGVNGDHHYQCLDSFCVPVGDGEEGYKAITSAFNSYKIGTFAQAIILNPLHPKLPRLPVLIMATCNKFDSDFVFRQWPGVQRLYEAEIEPIVGPLIGNSSDGDSRRRKMMLQLCNSEVIDHKFQPISLDLGFIFTCRREDQPDGFYVLHELCDHNYIHNHKKLLNPLDHATRVLTMGPYLEHMNHLKLVHDVFPLDEHGLGSSDIERRDRQNWASVQKLSFPKVRNCLERPMNRDGGNQQPNPTWFGTKTYLLIVWCYVEIFCSSVASLKTRVKYAAIVTHFLAIWFNYVQRQPQLRLRKNFITH